MLAAASGVNVISSDFATSCRGHEAAAVWITGLGQHGNVAHEDNGHDVVFRLADAQGLVQKALNTLGKELGLRALAS